MKIDLDKLESAPLLEAVDMVLEPELIDPAFWFGASVVAVRCFKTGVDTDLVYTLHALSLQCDRAGAEQLLRGVRILKTIEQLAGCIAVVKNLMLAQELTIIEAANVLWELANESTDSAHYVWGTSRVIDKLLRAHNVQPSKEESHGPEEV